MIVNLGPAESKGGKVVETLGQEPPVVQWAPVVF